jgi:DHA2 family multidrug resistance protein
LLTTFLARTAQTHQMQLSAHAGAGSAGYNNYISHITHIAQTQGMSAAQAGQVAVGYAYQQMLRQASMLAYKNAFAILAGVIICLTPLPFVMRLAPKAAKPSPEAMGH